MNALYITAGGVFLILVMALLYGRSQASGAATKEKLRQVKRGTKAREAEDAEERKKARRMLERARRRELGRQRRVR